MSFSSNINFASTVISFGCISFAASNFGIKFGRAITFSNTSGYKYISESEHKDKLYESIIKTENPTVAKTVPELRRWCKKYEKKARKWNDVSKYCLIKNNVRHQLLNKGLEIIDISKEQVTSEEGTNNTDDKCTEEVLNSYADESLSSVGYLFAKIKCVKNKQAPAAQPNGAARTSS